MATSKNFSFVNILLFCALFQKHYLFGMADNCVNPTFASDQRVVVDLFNQDGHRKIGVFICQVADKSNGLVNVRFRLCWDKKEVATCMQNDKCIQDRYWACNFKLYLGLYVCDKSGSALNPDLADCICSGSADDYLISNEALRKKYGIQKYPALAVNGKYDPCLKDDSFESIRDYFCKAYNNALPVCKG